MNKFSNMLNTMTTVCFLLEHMHSFGHIIRLVGQSLYIRYSTADMACSTVEFVPMYDSDYRRPLLNVQAQRVRESEQRTCQSKNGESVTVKVLTRLASSHETCAYRSQPGS